MRKVLTSSLIVFACLLLIVMSSVIIYGQTVTNYNIDLSQGVDAFEKGIYLSIGSVKASIWSTQRGIVGIIYDIQSFFGGVAASISTAFNDFINGIVNFFVGLVN